MISNVHLGLPRRRARLRGEQKETLWIGFVQVCLKISIFPNIKTFPVIKARSPDRFFVNLKPKRVDQMKHPAGHSHGTADVSRVVGDLGGMKDDVKHRAVLYDPW